MEEQKKTSPVDRIWDFLASVKLAIILFSLIALTSIIGTILEQQAAPEKNLKILRSIFGESLAPTVYRISDTLGFMDMYHSWWFLTLLMVFAVNIFICSIERFPASWRIAKSPIKPLAEISGVPIKKEITVKGKPEDVKELALTALKSAGFNAEQSKEADGYQLYSQKGSHTRLGVYVTHFSVLVILMGAIIGIIFGFKGFLNLPEGEAYAVAFKGMPYFTEEQAHERNVILEAIEKAGGMLASAASRVGVSEDHLRARMKALGIEPLGFSIRCEDFEVSFYGGSDMPSEYSSLLSIIDGGRETARKRIEVNDPLKYKGYTFYQSSYGMMPDISHSEFVLAVTGAGGVSETKRFHLGDSFSIPGTKTEAFVSSFSPALAMDESGRPFTYSETMNNPAVRLDIKQGATTLTRWIMKRNPSTWLFPDGYTIQFRDVWGAQYTGLQVRKDPGVWVVYLGCITMSIGLYIAFFMSHKKLWVRLVREKNNTKVIVGAYTNKNRQGFEKKIDKLTELLQKGGK